MRTPPQASKSGTRIAHYAIGLLTFAVICTGIVSGELYAPVSGTNISLGVYLQEQTGPIFYESFIPIIYEYIVPKYQTVDITLRDWREKCLTDKFAPSYTCPIFYHYERYLERFEAEMVPRAWVSTKSNPSAPMVTRDFCSSVQPHFPGSLTQQMGFEEYIDKLGRCPNGKQLLITRAINDYTFNIKQLFKTMNKNYETEFSNSFLGATNSKLSPAFYVNAVTSHQNGMLVAYLLEKERWSEAEIACNSHLIPDSLVKIDNFTNSLGEVKRAMEALNVAGSLPIEEASAYYKMPITDCSYVENNGNFIVRVQIPVLRKGVSPSLFKLESVPFIFDDDRGNGVNQQQLCQIRADPRTFIFDKNSGVLQASKCNPNSPLCKLENFASGDVVDLCVSSIFLGSFEGVRKHCEMDCTPWEELKGGLKMLPAFHQIQPDTWIVTGQPMSGVTLKCNGKQDQDLEHPEKGALQVKLPCACHLAHHNDAYYPDFPCEDSGEPIIKGLLPVHFVRADKIEAVQKALSSKGQILVPDIVVASVGGRMMEGFGAETSAHVSDGNSDNGTPASVTFIWVVMIIQLICLLAVAAVFIFKYAERRHKLNAFSKERLVYNHSSSNPNLSVTSTSSEYPYASQRSSVTENNLNIM